MELNAYKHRIDPEEDETCEECGEEEETIEHVLCRCPAEELHKRRIHHEEIRMSDMVSKPEICRKIMVRRFPELEVPDDNEEEYRKHDDEIAVESADYALPGPSRS